MIFLFSPIVGHYLSKSQLFKVIYYNNKLMEIRAGEVNIRSIYGLVAM